MGSEVAARCRSCEEKFTVYHGGGFRFHLLRCVRCGRETDIGFDELGDLHLRYLKGSAQPYTFVFAEEHRFVHDNLDIKPLTSVEYYTAVEEAAGSCECGGKFSFDAPARCPNCGSAQVEEGGVIGCYD
jgi:hypothetical protein